MEKNVAVLDIGSHKLVFASAHKTSKGIYTIKNIASFLYSGYYKGQWAESEKLASNFDKVITMSGYQHKDNTIYVSIPSDFVRIENNSFVTNFGKEKLITNDIISQMHSSSDIYSSDLQYEVVSSASMGYELDNGRVTLCAVGERTSKIKVNISYVLCKKSFINNVQSALSVCGFSNCKFVCSAWAQGSKLIDKSVKAIGAILCDIGFVNTSISYHKGEGIVSLKSVSIGGANIADDLSYALEIDFDSAQSLTEKINLSLDVDGTALISVKKGFQSFDYNAQEINDIVKARLDDFVDIILESCYGLDKPFENLTLYLSGGGLTSIKGAIAYLEKQIGHSIKLLIADIPQYDTPKHSSLIALIDVADELNKNKSFWRKIFG